MDIKTCVLLTAAIDPKGCAFVDRADPRIRERDYRQSLAQWIKNTSHPIVFCENSGYDLSNIMQIAEKARRKNRDIEVLQFDGNSYPREYGKGYGELLIIRHALAQSQIIKQSDYMISASGRYFITNVKETGSIMKNKNVYVMARTRKKYLAADSGYFVARPDFIKRYLAPFQRAIHDANGLILEKALYQAIENAVKDGYVHSRFKTLPFIRGYCGYGGGENYYVNGVEPYACFLEKPKRRSL